MKWTSELEKCEEMRYMRKEVRRLKENKGMTQMENDEVLRKDENLKLEI